MVQLYQSYFCPLLIMIPIISGVLVNNSHIFTETLAIITSLVVGSLALIMWLFYDEGLGSFQFISQGGMLGVDGIGIIMIVMTTIIYTLVITITIKEKGKEIIKWIIWSEAIIIGVFTVLDIRYFYICYELIIIPLFYIMNNSVENYPWRKNKVIQATKKIIGYTLFGSLIMLISLILIYSITEDLNIISVINSLSEEVYPSYQYLGILWFSLFLSFSIKIPIFPLHSWLPEAHSEAPTVGSIILAGVVLKMGTYAIIRFIIQMLPSTTERYREGVIIIGIIGLVYSSIIIMRQVELKKFIAFSSIAHMNLSLIGLFSNSVDGMTGGYLIMVNHGIVSTGMFYSAGILFKKYKLRAIYYYSSLFSIMPLFSLFWFSLSLSNIGFPPFGSFVSELLVFIGIFNNIGILVALIAATSIIISGIYGIWIITKTNYGTLNNINTFYNDLSRIEFFILLIILSFSIILGVFPNLVIDFILT